MMLRYLEGVMRGIARGMSRLCVYVYVQEQRYEYIL